MSEGISHKIYREFESEADARAYRRDHGAGGYIFACDTGEAFLFPHDMTPTPIMLHPLTRGRDGTLLC